jgi:murein DD-endopeptidase MepM/ murein hydrolase activator NlpD
MTQALSVYTWYADGQTDVLSIAARCTLPYDTVASINRFNSNTVPKKGTIVLLPSVPGLYIGSEHSGDLEYLLSARLRMIQETATSSEKRFRMITLSSLSGLRECAFLPGAEFNGTERAFFLIPLSDFPFKSTHVEFLGYRSDPFTGKRHFHSGIDLAAPLGTDVYAARDGIVSPWELILFMEIIL